jgi:thymidylate kinase
LLIEFCAPSGSGKTTLIKAWRRSAEASGIKVQRVSDLSSLARRRLIVEAFFRKRRRYDLNSFEGFCRAHCNIDTKDFFRIFIKNLVQFTYWRNKQPDNIVFFDESISHQFLRLCVRSNSSPEFLVEPYLKLMPRMDMIVTLSVPVEIAYERIKRRDAGKTYFFGGRQLDEAPRLLKVFDRACELLMEGAEQRGIRVLRCDGQASPEDNARKITDAINGVQPLPALAS